MLFELLLLLLFLFLFLLYSSNLKEGYQNSNPLTEDYDNFLKFYTSFCASWQKAITSSIAADTPQQPLRSPSDTSSLSSPVPTPSNADLNAYITTLSEILKQPLPPICISLPTQIDSNSIAEIIKQIPTSPQPYMNALNWMNTQLEKSHGNLNTALKGQSIEAFEDATCLNISQCIAENPELAQQLAQQITKQQQKQSEQSQKQQEQELRALINPFLENQALQRVQTQNNTLVAKSQDILNQAQSGELFNQVSLPPSGVPMLPTVIPKDGNKLTEMKQNDPDQYNHLKQNYNQWFQVKSLLEQINANLH